LQIFYWKPVVLWILQHDETSWKESGIKCNSWDVQKDGVAVARKKKTINVRRIFCNESVSDDRTETVASVYDLVECPW
jgi:hypothetical protein